MVVPLDYAFLSRYDSLGCDLTMLTVGLCAVPWLATQHTEDFVEALQRDSTLRTAVLLRQGQSLEQTLLTHSQGETDHGALSTSSSLSDSLSAHSPRHAAAAMSPIAVRLASPLPGGKHHRTISSSFMQPM